MGLRADAYAPLLSVSKYVGCACSKPRSFRMERMPMALMAAKKTETCLERRARAVRSASTAGFFDSRTVKTFEQ